MSLLVRFQIFCVLFVIYLFIRIIVVNRIITAPVYFLITCEQGNGLSMEHPMLFLEAASFSSSPFVKFMITLLMLFIDVLLTLKIQGYIPGSLCRSVEIQV